MSIEDANSNHTPASAGSCSTAEDVLDEIKSWIQSNDSAKLYDYAVAHIKSKVKRDLFCLEATWVERQYVKIVLEMWLRQSLKRAFEYLEDQATDISIEMSIILNEFNSINSFEDICSKLNGTTSRLKYWCGGGSVQESPHFKCRYLQLILEQRDLFNTMPRFVILVSSYFKQFKTLCVEKIFARCLNDIVKEETSGEKTLNFIFSLNELFGVADEDIRIQNILEANIPENYVTDGWNYEDKTGQDFVNQLVEIIAISSDAIGKELPQWFHLLQSDKQWTPKLQLLTKESFKKFLLPMKTEIKVKDEDGRKIIFVYGTTVFISKIIQKMQELKRDHPGVQEIQIVGLTSVHADCDLEFKDWHGINVSVVTHKLYVDRDNVLWDVSGKNGNQMAGELGQPGESGGNVQLICSEMIKPERWTIVSDGGDGSDGLNGGDGQIGSDGKIARKWSEENFTKSFPSMSTFNTGENTGLHSENAVKTVLNTLETILPKQNRTRKSSDIKPEHCGSFFVEGTASDGSTITASYYQSMRKRQTLILCKGSKVGSGGYGGTITYELVGAGREPIGVPFVGKEKRKATAVRMDVYETKGSDGRVGEAAGDVGFIHNLDTSLASAEDNLEGRFIGFKNEVSLEIKFSKTKPKGEQCDSEHNTFAKLSKKEYASIDPSKPRSFYEILSLRSKIKSVKKKAIIHQSLAQHLAPINERKQMTQSLQAMFCNPKEHETSNIEELIKQTEMKEAQLHQLTSQSSQRMEKIGAIRYVKPALKKTHTDLTRDTNYNRRSIGRRPVDFGLEQRERPQVVRCLDVLATVGGVDSALNSIFGRVNSDGFYLCNNTKTFRRHLAQFVRDIKNKTEVLALVGHFVLRMKNADPLDFPIACGIKQTYIEHQQENGENNPFNWEVVTKVDELFQEYAKFIELPSSALDSAELKLLARIHAITINVYEDQLSSFKFKESFNPMSKSKHFVLYEGGGEWKRLEANQNMQYFCTHIDESLFQCKPIQNDSYRNLMKWVGKNCTDQQIITSFKKLNPEFGETPDELFEILIFQNSIPIEQLGCLEKVDTVPTETLATDLGLLSEWVLEYNRRNISPIFYLHIGKEFAPGEWKYEFVLLELKELLTGDADKYFWDEDIIDCLKKFHERMPSVFSLLLKNLASTDRCSKVEPEQLLRLLQMLGEESDGYEAGTISEDQWLMLPLNDWFYELRNIVWQTKMNQLSVTERHTEKDIKRLKKEVVFMLLELEYKNGEGFCNELIDGITSLETAANKLQNVLYPGRRSQTESDQMPAQINVEEIISTMMTNMPQNKNFPKNYSNVLAEVKDKVMESKSKVNSMLDNKSTKKLIKTWKKNGLELTNQAELAQFLSVYDYAVQQICTKKGDEEMFRLRDTQRVTITTLITSLLTSTHRKKASFTQVSTGEGKSLIVAGVAIALALSRNDDDLVETKRVPGKKKIDVITSNDVLALRDSNLSFADGGLKDLYEYFNITVANNCSQSVDKRTQAYNATVVYGKLANFQRDYLLDEFYDSNIRNGRTMDLVIVDEVDCMLLDRGNNTLYLCHDIPGMEMLESLYVFIWEKIMRASFVESDKPTIKKSIKAAVLYDLHGTITMDDLDSIDGSLKDQPSEKNALWNHLIDTKVIDSHGRLIIIKDEVNKINYKKDLNPKIAFYFGNVMERERCIRIPHHLIHFVDRHLDSWLDNALQALELKRDEDYVVDQDRTDTSPDLNPQVIIIDQDTGTDQISSQWDGALHQFIQLKEGCKLTHQSLKAIFISNATYIQKYKKIAGASGTLGSKTERDFMENKYKCFFFTIPTAFVKKFDMKPTKVFKSKRSWLQAITKEAKKTVLPEEGDKVRSLVIFCQSIKDANTLRHHLKGALASEIGSSHIHCYTRDYEKFVFESESLQVGHVIIATNLAGRGTDIKISKQLRDNGGLHICLTFLPKNERIEEQAMGRAGRNGAPGSGIFLLCDETSSADGVKWGAGKFLTLKEERKRWELQRISRLIADFRTIEREEVFYEDILQRYRELKIQLTEKKCQDQEIQSICNSVLDKWALWLDETIEYLELSYFYYMNDFENVFLPRFKLPDNDLTDISWMTPVRSIALGKYFATHKTTKPNFSRAVDIFDRLIESSDSFWYPAAYYYRAFTLLKEDLLENKPKFIRTLRICETILNEHIDMQLNFYRKFKQSTAIYAQNFSFCIVEAYQQQKDNTVKILEYFIGSSRSLLGSHYCLVTDLKKDASDPPKKPETIKKILKKAELFLEKKKSYFRPFEKTRKGETKIHKICPGKVDKLFQSMFESKCLVCQLNDFDTAPNRSADIQRVANDYCISVSLEKVLESVFGKNLNEESIEKELKKIKPDLIPCTRKTFWNKLKEDSALLVLENGLCSDMKCVIMLESECDLEPNFNREEAITIDFGSSGYALYNPTYATRNDLLKQKKIIFSKAYIKDFLLKRSYQEYRHRKEKFEFNQIARIDFEKLRTVDLTSFGRLGMNDFCRVNIIPAERNGIWTALISQQIIDENGYLSSEYAGQKFNYPSCPAYEEAVMRLLGRTFVAEIVRRHWLKSQEDPRFLKSINLLPLKPYRDMLGDLMSAHVISGARVTDDTNINLEDEIKKIKDEDEEAQKCIVDFLKKRQAIYVAPRMKEHDVVLNLIERDIRMIADMNNISTELYDFGLVGFNHVINVQDRERSWKMVGVTSLISTLVIAGGAASLGVGAFLVYNNILSFGFCKDLLFMGGLSDILYAVTTILTRSHFTWADYGRQRIRSVMGKAEPIDRIKIIWEVFDSSEKTDEELRNVIRKAADLLRWKRPGKTELMTLSDPLLDNTITQLGAINQKDEFYFHSRLHSQCLLLCDFLIAKINKTIDKNSVEIKETLTQLYRLQGKDKAQLLADAKIKTIVTIWFEDGCDWVLEVEATIMSKVVEIGTSRETGSSILNNVSNSDIQSIEQILEEFNMRMRMVCKTLAHLQTFISELKNDNLVPTLVASDFDLDENKRFQKRAITDLKFELARKAEKVVEKLTRKVHKITSDHITQLADTNPKLYAAFL